MEMSQPPETELSPDEILPFEKNIIPKPEPKEVVASKKTTIAAQEGGVLRGATFEDQYRLAKAYHASGLMPKALDTAEKVLVALQLCYELQLPPMTSIGKICVINQTPSIFGDLPLALVRKSGLLKSIKETLIEKDGNLEGATCEVERYGAEIIIRQFTVADAKKASLWEKRGQSGSPTPWVLYPKRMLQMRARSWALKDAFPDVLMGISIAEYDHNVTEETLPPPTNSIVEELEKEYGDGDQQ